MKRPSEGMKRRKQKEQRERERERDKEGRRDRVGVKRGHLGKEDAFSPQDLGKRIVSEDEDPGQHIQSGEGRKEEKHSKR